jgi:hypothetical protein
MTEQLSHEEALQREFEEKEGLTTLGKVQVNENKSEDPEIVRLKEMTGHVELLKDNLPSRGRFYRKDMKILIRAAKVSEVRDFSTMDETNLLDVDDKLNKILVSCVKVVFASGAGSYKDILEEDRLFVILSVKELTFKNGENKIMMDIPNKCSQPDCELTDKYEFKTVNLQYHDDNETIEKYYNEDHRCYVVETKSSGTFYMAPPTIGVMRVITDYIKEKEIAKQKWDKSFAQTIPYLHRDWRNFNDHTLRQKEIEFNGWSTVKYTTVFRLAEMIKVGVKPEFSVTCGKCGQEATFPITFPGGLKSLFVIPNIADELL